MAFSLEKCYYLTLGFNKSFPDFSLNDAITENITSKRFLGY